MGRKRMVIMICAMVAVFLASIMTAVAVFAALQANVSSHFKVSYTAQNVHATISGSYYKTGEKVADFTAGESNVIEFNGTETAKGENPTNVKEFDDIDDITLKSTDYLVFEYVVENTDPEGDTDFEVTFARIGSLENFDMSYVYSETQLLDVDMNTEMQAFPEAGSYITLATMPVDETGYVYIRFTIIDEEVNANFDGGLDFILTGIE